MQWPSACSRPGAKTALRARCKSLFKVFACIRKCNKWPGSQRTPHQDWPSWQGGNKEHAHLLPCPKRCFAKAASAALLCFCSVFRALRLAATAFAKQRTRCEDFEQALGKAWRFAPRKHHALEGRMLRQESVSATRSAMPSINGSLLTLCTNHAWHRLLQTSPRIGCRHCSGAPIY